MFPQWARAYSFMMTQARGGRTNPITVAAGGSRDLIIVIGDTITINGTVVDIPLNKLRNFLYREARKYSKITITKNGTVYRTENDLNTARSKTLFCIGNREFKKGPWLDDLFGVVQNDAAQGLLALNPARITSRASTVSQEEKPIEAKEGQLQCLEVQDLRRPELRHNISNKIQVIKSDGRCYYLRLSDKKDSALLCELLEESEITLGTTVPNDKELIIDGNKLKLATGVDCSVQDQPRLAVPSYIELDWDPIFKTNNELGFQPTSYQFIPLKYAGNKLLLCHRPGFGKTINSILIAERMRNSVPGPKPKILLVVPDRKLLKQWVSVLKSMKRDLSNYIWMTYAIFVSSTTGNKDTSYPPYERINQDHINRLGEFVSWYQNGGPKPEKLTRNGPGLQKSKPTQKNIIYCKLCGRAFSFGAHPPIYIPREGTLNSLLEHGLEPSDIDNIRQLKDGKLVHRVWFKNNDFSDIRFTWDLDEDRILFHCKCIGPAKFITGFTPSDIEYSATINTWDDYKRQFGNPETEPPVKDKNYYLYREHEQYKAFEAYKRTLNLQEPARIRQNLRMNYIEEKEFVYHQYRPPAGCILVCDEIHKFVKTKVNITMQAIWKYSLNTPFTLFLTATPLEGNDYFKQVHYLSEMLKMKREYTSDLYLQKKKYEGFPPWHALQPMRKYKNVYDLTSTLKNKFSRHNTVDDISGSVEDLYKPVSKKNDKKYKLDATNLMALYTAKPLEKWVDNGKIEDGQNLYQFIKSRRSKDKESFVKKALETIYRKNVNLLGQAEFPVLRNKPDGGKIKNGIYNINLDYHRASMVYNNPNLELRFGSGPCKIDRDDDGYIRVTKGGRYRREDIRSLQTAILCNKIPDRGVYLIYPENGYPTAPIVSAYTGGLPEDDCPESYTLPPELQGLTVLGSEDDLKWLPVNPTRKLRIYSDDDIYSGIPYIPDLLGSKILHIVMTIEDAVRNGKNVMVYHERVELIRAVQRGLAMRKHQFKNAIIRNLESPIPNPEEGDYDMSPLVDGARRSAIRRFKTLPLDYRRSQNRDFKYGFTYEQLKLMEPDYKKEEWHTVYDDIINGDDFIHCNYKYFYKKYEKFWEASYKNFLDKAKYLAEFAEYADEVGVKQVVKDYLDLVYYAPRLKEVTRGKLTFDKREECITAMKLYSGISTEKTFQKLIVRVCKPYYEKAREEILKPESRVKHVKFKEAIKNINIDKQDEPIEEYNIEINPFRDYYLSKWSGIRFRSTYKPNRKRPTQYQDYAEAGKPPKATRDEFDMPNLDFDKWTNYISEHKVFFDKVKQIKIIGDISIQQLEISAELKSGKFPEKIESNRDFFNLYMYVDQYFLQQSRVIIDKDKKMDVDGKDMDQLSKQLIKTMDNPKFSEIRGKKKLNIGGKRFDQLELTLDRLRSRWTGMTSDILTFGILEGNSVKQEEYPKFVQAFSEGYVDCLLVSGSGIEGIDYKSCSQSLMICIDPVRTAGKKDQFNGRTVRKKSHHSLPENMRIVEEVTFCTKPYSENKKYEVPPILKSFEGISDEELREMLDDATSQRAKDEIRAEQQRRRAKALEALQVEELQQQVLDIEISVIQDGRITRSDINYLNRLTQLIRGRTEGWDEDDTLEGWRQRLGEDNRRLVIVEDDRQDPREDKITQWNAYFDTYVNLSHVLYTKNLVFISPDEYKQHEKYRLERGEVFKYFCHVCEQEDDLNDSKCKNCGATILRDGKPVYYHLMPIKGFIQPNDEIKSIRNGTSIAVADTNRVERDIVEMALSLQSLEHQSKLRGDYTTKIEIIKEDLRKKWYYRRVVNPSIDDHVDGRGWKEQMESPKQDKYKQLCDLYKSEEVTLPVPESSPPSFEYSIGDRVKIRSDSNPNVSFRGIITGIEYDVSDGWNGYYYKIVTDHDGVKYSEVWNDKDMEPEVTGYASDISIEEEYQ